MISGNQLKYYSSLLTKKYRIKENKFLIEGERNVLEGLESKHECEAVLFSNEYIEKKSELISSLKRKGLKTFILDLKQFKKVADTDSPQGIVAVFKKNSFSIEAEFPINDLIIVLLDNISDPGNVGTIIRNCDWFGIKKILFSDDTVEYTNPKVLRAAMGSIFHTEIIEAFDLKEIEKLKGVGYEIVCADIDGENIFNYKSDNKKILIFSNEAHGPSKAILKYVDRKITIPKIGKAESLNVASASAVILAELTK